MGGRVGYRVWWRDGTVRVDCAGVVERRESLE